VALFRKEEKKDEYDRDAILRAGEKAEAKGDRPRAIAEYEKVLRWEPRNFALHAKVAGLLGDAGRAAEAWPHFVTAGEAFARDGFYDKGVAVYTRAAAFVPTKVELWLSLADLNIRRQRKADAFKACLDGRRHFGRLEQHQQAGQLLRRALEIEPYHVETTLDLARVRRRAGQRDEATRLLQGIASRNRGPMLRRIRGAQLRLRPTPAALWRWVRAAVTGK
jgi:tetratricopeptide (TPR) repeat protein